MSFHFHIIHKYKHPGPRGHVQRVSGISKFSTYTEAREKAMQPNPRSVNMYKRVGGRMVATGEVVPPWYATPGVDFEIAPCETDHREK